MYYHTYLHFYDFLQLPNEFLLELLIHKLLILRLLNNECHVLLEPILVMLHTLRKGRKKIFREVLMQITRMINECPSLKLTQFWSFNGSSNQMVRGSGTQIWIKIRVFVVTSIWSSNEHQETYWKMKNFQQICNRRIIINFHHFPENKIFFIKDMFFKS